MLEYLKRIYRRIRSILKWQKFAFANYQKPLPVYTKSGGSGLKLHIGAGAINVQGWINVDGRKFEHTHLVSEGFELKEFADGAVKEIYLCHVLEHFSFRETEMLLKSFYQKIANGGVIRISVPDFDALVAAYKADGNNLDGIKAPLMGGQDYSYNYHKAVFNKKSLTLLLKVCGYSNVVSWHTLSDFGVDLGDWSSGTITASGKMIPISLNLKAIK